MDSSAVAYDTADMSESARDSGRSWPSGGGVLNADGGVCVTIIGLGGPTLVRGGLLEVAGGGIGSAGDDELASDCGFGGELTTGGDKGAAGSGLGFKMGSEGSPVSSAGASCRLSLDDESLRDRCCCISTGDSVVFGKPARGDEVVLAGLALGIWEADPDPW